MDEATRRKRRKGVQKSESERERERERGRGRARGWIEERISVLWMEFGMRESSGRADSRRHATRAHEKLWLLPPVNGEGQPTKNNITFYRQPNFVARWWASARPAVCYRRPLSRAHRSPLTTSASPILATVIDHRKTFEESRGSPLTRQNEFRNGVFFLLRLFP